MYSKWTIGTVNYNSSCYIKYQLKILFEFNNPSDFKLIIVDNSQDYSEYEELKKLTSDYNNSFNNIIIIKHNPECKTASGQHGEGLDIIREQADCEYLIVQDPDYFWLKKDYLNWLEHLLKFNDAVGIPYPRKVYEGNPYFPGAFGCAYKYDKMKNLSFKPYLDNDFALSWKFYNESTYSKKDYDFGHDVGWKIRKELSCEENDHNFISFEQFSIGDQINKIVNSKHSYSFDTLSTAYYFNQEIVALHLFRGTFTGKVNKLQQDASNKIGEETYKLRHRISELMYEEILNNKEKLTKALINKDLLYKDLNAFISKISISNFILFRLKKIRIIKFFIPKNKKFYLNKIFKRC